ncbi:MAG: hypothetical protein AB1791_17310 [Chloroflexota bacterium]
METSLLADLLLTSIDQGKRPQLTIATRSMVPLLRPGDQVCLGPADLQALQVGDLIAVAAPARLLIHRYWGPTVVAGQRHLLTRGDRPLTFDPPWPADCLVGQVIARRRGQRRLWLTHGRGRWLNRWLARLSALELRLLSDSPQLGRERPGERVNLPSPWEGEGPGVRVRLIRRAFLTLATLLSELVSLR